jgi:Tetratricopeptide repeat
VRVLRPDDPDTLLTRNNLAAFRPKAGDPTGAAAYQELLDDQLRVLGPDHPDTLAARNNLAYWRGEAGDPAGAAAAYQKLVTDRLRVLGPDQPSIPTTPTSWPPGTTSPPAGRRRETRRAPKDQTARLAKGLSVVQEAIFPLTRSS